MPSLHILFDPKDMIRGDVESAKRLGIKVARIDLADDIDEPNLGALAETLTCMLLEQVYGSTEGAVQPGDGNPAVEVGGTGGS